MYAFYLLEDFDVRSYFLELQVSVILSQNSELKFVRTFVFLLVHACACMCMYVAIQCFASGFHLSILSGCSMLPRPSCL